MAFGTPPSPGRSVEATTIDGSEDDSECDDGVTKRVGRGEFKDEEDDEGDHYVEDEDDWELATPNNNKKKKAPGVPPPGGVLRRDGCHVSSSIFIAILDCLPIENGRKR